MTGGLVDGVMAKRRTRAIRSNDDVGHFLRSGLFHGHRVADGACPQHDGTPPRNPPHNDCAASKADAETSSGLAAVEPLRPKSLQQRLSLELIVPASPKPGEKVRGARSGAPIMALLDLLCRRWAVEVLWALCEHEELTFDRLGALCETSSPAELSQRLNDLQEAKLLTRTVAGYAPTQLGLRVYGELLPLGKTARCWRDVLGSSAAGEVPETSCVDGGHRPIDRRHTSRTANSMAGLVGQEAAAGARGEALWVPYRGSVVRLPIQHIVRMDAERDYVRVNDADRSYLLRVTLSELCDRLGERFLRIHRSIALARDRVTGLRHVGGGSWTAVDADGAEFPIGRTYLADVRSALLRHGGANKQPTRDPQRILSTSE